MVHESKIHKDTEYIRQNHQRVENQSGKKWQRIEQLYYYKLWSVLKAKRKLLRYPDGFKAQFYNLSEILIPTLAWGFFGPDESMSALMNYFRDQVLDFIKGLYDVNSVRFSNVNDLSYDIMTLAKVKFEQTLRHMGQLDDTLKSS